MKRLGSLQLHLEFEDGSSRYLYQDTRQGNSPWYDPFQTIEFSYYTKPNPDAMFTRIRKPSTIRTGSGLLYGEPGFGIPHASSWYDLEVSSGVSEVTLGGLNIIEENPRPQRRNPTRNYIREMQESEAYQAAVRHEEHLREHRLARNEIARRAAQAESDRRRVEEERNRTRTPWQRFRNLF